MVEITSTTITKKLINLGKSFELTQGEYIEVFKNGNSLGKYTCPNGSTAKVYLSLQGQELDA